MAEAAVAAAPATASAATRHEDNVAAAIAASLQSQPLPSPRGGGGGAAVGQDDTAAAIAASILAQPPDQAGHDVEMGRALAASLPSGVEGDAADHSSSVITPPRSASSAARIFQPSTSAPPTPRCCEDDA